MPPAARRPADDPLVPRGLDVAAAWSWRLLVVAAAAVVLGAIAVRLSLVTAAVAAALLLAAGLQPLAARLVAKGVPRLVAAWVVLVAFVGVLVGAGWSIGSAVVGELDDLRTSVAEGVERVRDWLVSGPLPLGAGQVDSFAQDLAAALRGSGSGSGSVAEDVVSVATLATHVVTGIALALFVLFFFLADGRRVWQWVVRLAPARARERVDAAGAAAWGSLTSYVRGMVVVALLDAVLIGLALLVVGVPLALPLAALTFLGAFVPVVGALLAGSAAVLVALVNEGVVPALLVAAAVLAVQWLDSDVVYPVVVGRAVELHPLAIGLSVTVGGVVGGIGGALVAVPLVAAANAAAVALRAP